MNKLNFAGFTITICLALSCKSFVITTLEADRFDQTLKQTPNPQLIDVRTPQEYSEGYLPGAVLMDIRAASFDSLMRTLDKTRPVFVYCRSGRRSLDAANILEKNKFEVVYNLDGGIIAWKNRGKVIVK